MAAKIFHDPNTVLLGAAPILGCKSISYSESDVPQTARSDAGTVVHFVAGGGAVNGAMVFQDAIEANKVASQKTADVDLTFKVNDEAGLGTYVVTITNIKTGGIQTGYTPGESGVSVPFVGDSASDPTIPG